MALLINSTIRLDLSGLSLPSGTLLQNHPIIRAVGAISQTRQRNEVHYDTPDFALRRDHLALTLNRQGEQWIQRCCIETNQEPSSQWVETPIPDNQLDIKAFKTIEKSIASPALTHLRHHGTEVLAPVFTLHCREEQWTLYFPDNVHIILREEQGYLKFGAARQPFHELVMERQSGDLSRWFQIALLLADHFSPTEKTELGLSCATPVTRGFAWLDPTLIMPTALAEALGHTPAFDLHPDMTTRQAFVLICMGLLQRIQACRGIILFGGKQAKLDSIQWLYQTINQLHTLIVLCHALLPEEIRDEIEEEIRWFLRELDYIREWQAFLGETLGALMEQFPAYPGLEALLHKAREGQQLAVKRLAKALVSYRYTRLILGLANWSAGNHWEFLSDSSQREGMAVPISRFAGEIVQRYHNALSQHGINFSNLNLSVRCGLRDDVDRLAHTTHLFGELFGKKRPTSYQDSVGRLQSTIHSLIDLHTSNRFFARLIDKNETTIGPLIQGWQGARTSRRLLDSSKEWQQFSREPIFW